MPDDSIKRLGGRATRRGLLKGAAAVGLGAVTASALPGVALAAGPDQRSDSGPGEKAREHVVGTPSAPTYLSFSGLGDFRSLLASNTWGFQFAYVLQATNSADGYVARLQIPQGATIQSVAFYVQNPTASVSPVSLFRVNPATHQFVSPHITQPVPPGGTVYQTVNLDLAGGLVVDNAVYAYYLAWYPQSGQSLAGATVAYINEPGVQLLATPVRVVDTRVSSGPIGGVSGPLANGSITDFAIAGANGIPANATAVFGNLTAVEFSPGNGYMTLYPTGAAVPNASSINFGGGEPNQLANFFQVKLGTGGKVRLYVSGTSTNAILDIAGYVI